FARTQAHDHRITLTFSHELRVIASEDEVDQWRAASMNTLVQARRDGASPTGPRPGVAGVADRCRLQPIDQARAIGASAAALQRGGGR
ncbi:hypothetical protein AAHH79_35010, partial [Burkholderia pseudomallei]